jgi:hypothetical protein
MHDFDSRPKAGRAARPAHPRHLAVRRALALLALAMPLAAGTAAATDRTEDQRLIWTLEELPLPASSHFGASLAMAEEGLGEAWIGAPQGGAWADFIRDPTGETGWFLAHVGPPSAPVPQAFAAAGHLHNVFHTHLHSDGTTRIVTTGGGIFITGIVGDVAAVGSNGTVIAVGQPDHNGGNGRVLIYVYSPATASFELDHTFVGGSGLRLGTSVAVNESFVFAGAPGFGDNGAVYVLAQAADWFVWQRIDSPATSQVDQEFGAAIAAAGPWLAIGSPMNDRFLPGGGQVDCGGVWMYRAAGLLFELDAFVRPDGIAAGDRFGSSVAMRRLGLGATLVAGSPRADHQFGNSGAAYLFLRSTTGWSERLRLIDSAPGAANNLGARVALHAHDVLVSAPNATANGVFQQGQVLVFRDVVPLLGDGFESGDLDAWNGAAP